TLATTPTPAPPAWTGAWPPPDAEPLPVDGLYDQLAGGGFTYGPAFQGLRPAWRHGRDILAEIALPVGADAQAGDFSLHPALLDAALHGLAFTGLDGLAEGLLPFSWQQVTCHRTGPAALRVRLSPAGPTAVEVTVHDPNGTLIAHARQLVL